MENKATIVFADKDLEMLTVKCPGFKVCYIASYGSKEVDVHCENGETMLTVFVPESFDETLRKVSERVNRVNTDVDDGCALVFTL